MLVNSVTNFNYSQPKLAHKAVETPEPEQKPVENQGVTATLYFGENKDKDAGLMRKATMAGLGSLMLLTTGPLITTGCSSGDSWAKAEAIAKSEDNSSAVANDTAYFNINTHGRGCNCDSCRCGKDTVYKYDTIVVDTGSYHVIHDTIEKWIDDWEKPIPLDSIAKDLDSLDVDVDTTNNRRNVVHYEATREWEYGEKFVADMNQLESSKNVLVYDREDKDWQGNHTGWGKDVYRIPTSSFLIKTYGGKTIINPKGYFVETYTNEADKKESIFSPDEKLVTRQFLQTIGDSVYVFTYDPQTKLYREDGRVAKGYLDKKTSGNNILLKDLIASDPSIKWSTDPNYSTEDHLVGVKVVTVNDEELKLLYIRARDDEYAEKHYGIANN